MRPRFSTARRGLHFGFSNFPAAAILASISLASQSCREPYSPSIASSAAPNSPICHREHLSRGTHTFKFGGDFNLVQLRSSKAQNFELDFAEHVNFGGLNPFGSSLPAPPPCNLRAGRSTTYIQGSEIPSNPRYIRWDFSRRTMDR